jgi:hypothetical protein
MNLFIHDFIDNSNQDLWDSSDSLTKDSIYSTQARIIDSLGAFEITDFTAQLTGLYFYRSVLFI